MVVQRTIKEILTLQINIILKVKTVVKPKLKETNFSVTNKAFTDDGFMINSSFLNGLNLQVESIEKAINYLEEKKIRKKKNKFQIKRLGDI